MVEKRKIRRMEGREGGEKIGRRKETKKKVR